MRRLTIYSDFDAYYNSLYVKGLLGLFPRKAIRYSSQPFPRSFSHHLAFVVHDPKTERDHRVFVCHRDYSSYHEAGLAWCDVYAKVNIDPGSMPVNAPAKVISIGPNFGLRVFRPLVAVYRACVSFRMGDSNPREHFANYYRQARYGVPERALTPGVSDRDYVFFAGSLWHEEPEANRLRGAFIEACQSIESLRFEGGFVPNLKVTGYEKFVLERPYPIEEYIEKTRRSVVAFNNPAYAQAHSWRLGEYLALGKAIISTPLARLLPEPLVHGREIHYVEPTIDAIRAAVELIRGDDAYRRTLEQNARAYYLQFVRPAAVMTRVLHAAGLDMNGGPSGH